MAASTSLCTRDALKAHLGLTGTQYDTALDNALAAASEAVEAYCGRNFGPASHTEFHDGGSDRLVLKRRPVTALAEVYDDPDLDFTVATLVDPDEYVLDADGGIVHLLAGCFTDGVRNVKVVYTSGYSAVPDDVAHAGLLLAAAWFNRGRAGGDGLAARGAGGVSAAFAGAGFPEDVRALLTPYRDQSI